MQAVRLATRARLPSTAAPILRRTMATTTQPMPSAAASEEPHLNVQNARRQRQTRSASDIPLSNLEAQWDRLTADEQAAVYGRLEEIQKRDWKTLSLDEKKAGAYTPSSLYSYIHA
jgi:cytochrome c oxidase subunit 4